ncbi:propanediol utilization microcompartment protein PduB [Peptoniphilus sp. SGI.035]|uniref:Microcompartment protein PduB n=1 Tax=Peptoniphilus porci TaxID=2652280 RepID=A0A1U7M1I0_9FIRM|nr:MULTISPECIES: propanediol utilization microcompartment protein PduB [Peptoniphilus]MDD7353228.1 propanediol utilization microcompartment protein PduB [Peptoniphilaceae bacterium]MDY3903151.1 propanediol utilization microcompartment protein PduB [Peptoniphilus sp.]OLR65530.1 microcompartment protein PduB [Peptoniphilus porci]
MDKELLEKIMGQVSNELGMDKKESVENCSGTCKKVDVTEFVGTSIGDTIGLVIASVDPLLVDKLDLGKYKSIGIIGSRTGAGPQIMAVDDAVKATNTEVVTVELPRDTKGGAGHGSLIYIGAEDVSDARRAVEIALDVLPKYFGDVYENDAGHLEFQYTARASYCLEKSFGTPIGKSFGMVIGAPAAIGTVLADVAVKAANVEVVGYSSPAQGTSFSNEVILTFTGDSGAVRQAVKASIDVGKKLLGALGDEPKSTTSPYI